MNPPTTTPTPLLRTTGTTGEEILQFIEGILPILEASIPAVGAVAGPIGLGTSAAALLLKWIGKVPIGGTYTVEYQQDILRRVQAISLLDFQGPIWQQQPIPGDPAVPPPPIP